MSESTVTVSVVEETGQINLRGDPENAKFRAAVQDVLGQPLPVEPNSVTASQHRICWLGPDEWLILTTADRVSALVGKLEGALVGQHAAINDLSGGQLVFTIRGESACDLFAKGCTLDFHTESFPPGSCAQSGLAKASVFFVRSNEADVFDIIVRRSFSDYLSRWLREAGREYGVDVGFEFA